MIQAITKAEAKRFITAVRKAHDVEIAKVYATKDVVSTEANGLAPQLPNDTTKFLRGDGTWKVPTTGSGTATINPGRGLEENNSTQAIDVNLSNISSLPANNSTFNINTSNFLGNFNFNDNIRIYTTGAEIGNVDITHTNVTSVPYQVFHPIYYWAVYFHEGVVPPQYYFADDLIMLDDPHIQAIHYSENNEVDWDSTNPESGDDYYYEFIDGVYPDGDGYTVYRFVENGRIIDEWRSDELEYHNDSYWTTEVRYETVTEDYEKTALVKSISETTDGNLIITTNKDRYVIGPDAIGGSGSNYTLPAATSTTRGGIKLGRNVAIDDQDRIVFQLTTIPLYQEGAIWIEDN